MRRDETKDAQGGRLKALACAYPFAVPVGHIYAGPFVAEHLNVYPVSFAFFANV